MNTNAPSISVVVCTHNPDLSLLREVIGAIESQDFGEDFETILVDNCSAPGIDQGIKEQLSATAIQYQHEAKLGLSHARRTGIRSARAAALCFVDDDNILAADYLRVATDILRSEPRLGVFGGQCHARLRGQPDPMCRHFLARYAIRTYEASATLEAPIRSMRGLEPFGAGMIVRRDVALRFSDLMEVFAAETPLGRVGTELGSGEDSLFTRVAFTMGLQAGYRPNLRLEHVIPDQRLRWNYLKRLLHGQARSEAILDHLDNQWPGILEPGQPDNPMSSALRFLRRLYSSGLAEAVGLAVWDRSYSTSHADAKSVANALQKRLHAVGLSASEDALFT